MAAPITVSLVGTLWKIRISMTYPKAIQLPFIMVELNAAGHFLEATEERMLVRKMAAARQEKKRRLCGRLFPNSSKRPSGTAGMKCKDQQMMQRCSMAEVVSIIDEAEPDFLELMNMHPNETPARSASKLPSRLEPILEMACAGSEMRTAPVKEKTTAKMCSFPRASPRTKRPKSAATTVLTQPKAPTEPTSAPANTAQTLSTLLPQPKNPLKITHFTSLR
mmetsp:Transcript_50970/g.111140  ORF Transcript_50970/g.111140 Transcript_50970/m.111140 type:complete len:221 (-) Transcript_50970:37-699(-)